MLRVHRLGRVRYGPVLRQQIALKDALRREKPGDDYLILVEHEPVVTLGRGWQGGNLILPEEKYSELGIDIHHVSRGGDVTYHGPGQLVAYPIFDLNRHGRDLHRFLHNIEETAIHVLASYGLSAGRKEGLTGAWVDNAKVCAIGVAVSSWISYHGLAFNIDPIMQHFGLIIPCGITSYPVSSLSALLGYTPDFREVEDRFVRAFVEVFDFNSYGVFDDTDKGELSCLDEKGLLVRS
ncbi:MAG: lipoyl(octanoyl) transferase LipB [Planctomycetota bacterium]